MVARRRREACGDAWRSFHCSPPARRSRSNGSGGARYGPRLDRVEQLEHLGERRLELVVVGRVAQRVRRGLDALLALLVLLAKILLELEFMEEAERPSATKEGVMKKYKVLVGRGLEFGVNQANPQSPGQTSPYYHRETFPELAKLLLEAK